MTLSRLGVVVSLLAYSAVLSAQIRPDAGSVLEGTKPAPATPKLSPEVLPRAAEPRPALGAPGLKVNVTAFKISGNTIYPEDVLLETVKEFVGKEQNIDGLNDAATKVRAYYRERGYFLSQAYLPQQEIRGGLVEIAVIEARLGKVALDFRQGTRFSEGLIRGIIEQHLAEGDAITESGLETPLLLLNDFPNAVVTSEIKPSKTVGAADLTVHVSSAPGLISGTVDIDNSGNRFTGAIRTGVSFNLSNPFSLGDQISYRSFITDENMGFNRIAYTVPIGYWGTRIGTSYSSFHYQLAKDFAALQAHGAGGVTTVFAFHPWIRTRSSNFIMQFAFEDKRTGDRVESGLATIENRRVVSSKLGLIGDIRDGIFGGGLNSFGFEITEGRNDIGPFAVLVADQGGRRTAGRFQKYAYEFRRLQKISDSTTVLFSLQGQKGAKNLPSAEKTSLGGSSGVRAYPAGEGLGDTGYVFQTELRYLVPGFKVGNGDLSLSAFYDQGFLLVNQNKSDTDFANSRRLNGYGFGASVGKDSDFIVRAHAALRLERETPLSDTADRTPRLWVQAIKWF